MDNLFPSASKHNISTASWKPRSNQEQQPFTHAIEQAAPFTTFEATGLNKKSGLQVLKVTEIYHYPLKNYLTDTRKIPLNIASRYLKEIHCKVDSTGKDFYALGFPAGKTYSLRNKYFKGFASTGVDISVFAKQTERGLLFEGFMDFLSYLTAKQLIEPDCTAIVMNSSTMLHRVVEYLKSRPDIKNLEYFRDRDELAGKTTGIDSLKSLQETLLGVSITDQSNTYAAFKDLNDWWIDFSSQVA